MDQIQHQQQSKACLNCPRCNSTNTKFCYYNNYSLSQPRHFCKACKRYWTRGGTLRNVPVGGSCRKNGKRLKRLPSSLPLSAPAHPSSNQISQIPTSTIPAATETSNNLLSHPLLYNLTGMSSVGFKDTIQSQQCNNLSDTSLKNGIHNYPFVSNYNKSIADFHCLRNATRSQHLSSIRDHNESATRVRTDGQDTTISNQASQLLQGVLPLQAMQHQHQHHQTGDPPAQSWIDNLHQNDPSTSGSLYWTASANVAASWPPNHLTNMDD